MKLNRRQLKKKILAETLRVFKEERDNFGCQSAVVHAGRVTYVHLAREYSMFSELNRLTKLFEVS